MHSSLPSEKAGLWLSPPLTLHDAKEAWSSGGSTDGPFTDTLQGVGNGGKVLGKGG